MTQEPNHFTLPSGAFDISRDVERLMSNTHEDLSHFHEEVKHLMLNVNEVVAENKQLRLQLDKYKQADARKPGGLEEVQQRSQMTEDALANALKQIDSLRKERSSLKLLQECSQRTIDSMEKELKNYRRQLNEPNDDQIIKKYIKAIKMLEEKIASQKESLRAQAEMIKVLNEHKQRNGMQIEEMQAKLQKNEHCSVVINEHSTEIAKLKQQVMEYEQRLHQTQNLLKECNKRESAAMTKVQEALSLSESAVREKTEAEKRAVSYKEELAQLAANMGIILQEEAKRVDSEVATLRAKQREKVSVTTTAFWFPNHIFLTHRFQLKQDKAEHLADMAALQARYTRLEKKYNEVVDQYERIDAELEETRKRLSELERNGLIEEQQKNSELKINESRLSDYMQHHRQKTIEYKETVKDLTIKFQGEVRRLMDMNSELKAEIKILKDEEARGNTI
ncbi:CAP-Gly domain-containing linker protein 1 isoform X1 [Drosophila obscura]|uniref:CAP-Gly domain-containing linker protein 1 isoform X1 n=1 Tax=Drosophila obscura TaxID=7282 RepID=UPI001BB21119|nr:CAP-Gly domain-containing linker protein 1 isoform X1 [Drosophila obscura]